MATNQLVGTATGTGPTVNQLSMSSIVALHLVPGALVTVAFVGLAPLVAAAGFPPIAALLIAIVVVLVPFELGVMAWAAGGARRLLEVVPYRRPMPLRDWLWLVPTLIVLAFIGFGAHMVVEPGLIDRLFGWLPAWFVAPIDPDHIGDFTRAAWIVTLVAFFAINGLVGPIVEELYFRGFLLPRMERFGRWAPLVNVGLFSLYHFWSPWQLVARILGFGPTVYMVGRRRNVYLGMVVHCSLNILSVAIVAAMVVGRL